jgi:hypothetical protein
MKWLTRRQRRLQKSRSGAWSSILACSKKQWVVRLEPGSVQKIHARHLHAGHPQRGDSSDNTYKRQRPNRENVIPVKRGDHIILIEPVSRDARQHLLAQYCI